MRSAIRLLASLAALVAVASPARANVTGNLELQSTTTQNVNSSGAGSTQATLLSESLSLHYAGLPFGPAVAIATMGGGFSNVTGWGQGLQLSGRVYSFDASVGFLPRRAVPLRLYAAGSVEDGATGALVSRGPGLSVLYGGTINSEPGRYLPGLRLDASEGRSARPGHDAMSDIQRRIAASGYGNVAGQRVNLALQVDDDHRDGAGDASNRAGTLSVSSPFHQTTVLATENRRSLAVLATQVPTPTPQLPPAVIPSGITTDRALNANSDQRWSPYFSTQVGGRLSESGAGVASATGTVGDVRAGATWVPVRGTEQVTLSGAATTGFTHSQRTDPNDPQGGLVGADGTTWGAAARASYGRPVSFLNLGVGAGAGMNGCDCASLGNDGVTHQVDGTLTASLLPAGRVQAQLDHTVSTVWAPLSRGGDRLENHSRGTARFAVGQSSAVNAGLSYDDGFREFFDVILQQSAGLHERAAGGSLGFSTQLGRVACSTEVRYSRGTVVTNGSGFIAGGATQVRSMTSGYGNASWSPFGGLALQGQLVGSRAEFTNAPGMTSAGATAALVWRLGRVNASLQYQGAQVRFDGQPSTFQQSIRALLSRPFELWR